MSRFIVIAACVLVAVVGPPRHAAAADPVVLSPPTDAPVLDPFRLPSGPYGPGNRGIEYATGPGDRIVAAADGRVAFAGQVAGSWFVSLDHPGGLRTTYGYVGRILVRAGTNVPRGTPVAVADGPIHFTVRLRGVYIDPARVFGRARVRLRLVSHHGSGIPGPTAGLSPAPDTLPGGPSEPRTVTVRDRRNHRVRATPGRLGVPHEHTTGKEDTHGSHLHEAAAGGRRSLRPPDPPLEPQDEAVHPR